MDIPSVRVERHPGARATHGAVCLTIAIAAVLALRPATTPAAGERIGYLCTQRADEVDIAAYHMLIWIDYGARTAAVTDFNSNQPTSNDPLTTGNYSIWTPITVDGSQVAWDRPYLNRSTDKTYVTTYRFDRDTGALAYYLSEYQHTDHFVCEVDPPLRFPSDS
jgi:hypothetical protein